MGLISDIVRKGWLRGGKLQITKSQVQDIINNGYILVKDDKDNTFKITIKPECADKANITAYDLDVEIVL